MTFLRTSVSSITGSLFYSDQIWKSCRSCQGLCENLGVPFLNQLANVPIIGRITGLVRIILAPIHIVGHLIASLVTRNVEHLCHVLKGLTELLRGILEIIPIIGEIFSWCYNPSLINCDLSHRNDTDWVKHSNFFLVKIYNPDQPDQIDEMMDVSRLFPARI